MDSPYKFFRRKKKSHKEIEEITENEIVEMVDEGRKNGALRNSEAAMVHNIFDLDDKTVKDIMVHRSDMDAIDGNLTLKEAIDFFIKENFSRYPVYINSIDNIIGIVHIKDILKHAIEPSEYDRKIRDLSGVIRKAETVPETHGVYTLFTTMKLNKTHLAIVVDEYGQTSGLVTMEDILEEIVGNIQDEHDNDEAYVMKEKPGIFIMDGKTPIEDVCSTLGFECEIPDIETLNGYLVNLLGKIPENHTSFDLEAHGYKFHVMDVENRVIKKVRISLR